MNLLILLSLLCISTSTSTEAPVESPTETKAVPIVPPVEDTETKPDEKSAEPLTAETRFGFSGIRSVSSTLAETADAPADEEYSAEDSSSHSEEDTKEEAAPIEHTPAHQQPVVAHTIPTGAEAVMEGVTVRGTEKRGYIVTITNGSDTDVCGVTFTAEGVSDVWHLFHKEDGSFLTKDLHLTPGAKADQFGYGSTIKTKPTVTAITFC